MDQEQVFNSSLAFVPTALSLAYNTPNPTTTTSPAIIKRRNNGPPSPLRVRASNLGVKILATFYFLISVFLSLSLLSHAQPSPPSTKSIKSCQPQYHKRRCTFPRKKIIKRNPSLQVFYIMDGDKNDEIALKRRTLPSPPQYLEVQIKCHSVLLSWKRPKDDGGYEEIKYVVEQKDEGELHSDWVPLQEVCGEELEVMHPPDKFWFRVAAKNGSGMSDFCDICGEMEHKSRIFLDPPTPRSQIEDFESSNSDIALATNLEILQNPNSEISPHSANYDSEDEEDEEEDIDELYARL